MSEELDANAQQDDSIIMPVQLDKNNTVAAESESSTDSGVNHDNNHNGVQDRINKVTAQKYTEQRRADGLQRELDEMKNLQPKPVDKPVVAISAPQLPEDLYDDDAMRKYHADNQKYNQELVNGAAKNAYESQIKQGEQQKAQQAQQQVIDGYYQNAQRDGVDLDKLRVAEQTFNNSGISNELAQHVMADVNGGKIVEFLHDNPALLHEISNMNPMQAAIKLANEIKPQVLSRTPKVSSAPIPPIEVSGGGVHEQDEFEKNYPGATFI